jgi:hypothetical protein
MVVIRLEVSATLPDVCSMARYLFSSSSKAEGGVFLLDSGTGETRRVFSGPSRGLTAGPDGYYVVSGYRNPTEGCSTIHRLEPEGWRAERVAEFPLGDCHDLRWIGGHFYLVASLGNQIVRLDERCREVDRIRIVPDERDICHVNCIAESDGALYCTIFTLSPGERSEKRYTDAWFHEGKILRLDWSRGAYDILYEPLAQPHSLQQFQGGLYLVESHTSSLVRVDPATRRKRVLGAYTGFLRGMAFGPGEAVLGASLMYRKDRKRRRPLSLLRQWQERLFPFAGLVVVNTKTWKTRRRVPVEKAEVYDVLCLE